jgi:hypothetical protein
LSEQGIVQKLTLTWDFGYTQNLAQFARHALCQRFLDDQPWSADENDLFTRQARVPLNSNRLRTYCWHMMGLQRMARSRVEVVGVDGMSDPQMADIAYRGLKHVGYVNNQTEIDSLVFRDGLVGMGCWLTYFNPFKGRMVIERVEPGDVVFDPNATMLDLTNCGWVARRRWMRAKQVVKRWPKAEVEFTNIEFDEWWSNLSQQYRSILTGENKLIDRQNDLYAVIELYEREETQKFIIKSPDGREVGDWTLPLSEGRAWMEAHWGYVIAPKTLTNMKKTCFMPYRNTVLSEEIEDYSWYPYVPYMSGWAGQRFGDVSSFIYGGISPQRLYNLNATNNNEYVQRELRGGGYVFDDPELTKRLNSDGAHAHLWYDVKGTREPVKRSATPPAQGLLAMQQAAAEDLEVTMALKAQPYGGAESSGESGVYRKQLREESQVTVFPMLEVLDAQKGGPLAHAILERWVKHTNAPQMLRAAGKDGKPEETQLTMEMIQGLKEVEEFDIRVGEGHYATEQSKQDFERRMMQLSLVAANNPGCLMPSDFIRGAGVGPDEEQLAKTLDKRYILNLALRASMANQAKTQGENNGGRQGKNSPIPQQ